MENYKRISRIHTYYDKVYEEIDDFMNQPINKEELKIADEICKNIFKGTDIKYKLDIEPKIVNNTLYDYVEIACEIHVCVEPEYEEEALNLIYKYVDQIDQAEITELPPELAEAENDIYTEE